MGSTRAPSLASLLALLSSSLALYAARARQSVSAMDKPSGAPHRYYYLHSIPSSSEPSAASPSPSFAAPPAPLFLSPRPPEQPPASRLLARPAGHRPPPAVPRTPTGAREPVVAASPLLRRRRAPQWPESRAPVSSSALLGQRRRGPHARREISLGGFLQNRRLR